MYLSVRSYGLGLQKGRGSCAALRHQLLPHL